MWTSKSVNCYPSSTATCICWTFWGSMMPVHGHLVFHTETVQPDKLLNAGYICFNENDSTKLEDWLIDIDTSVDLTSESTARLAKAKSWNLMHTVVTEVISSNKSWDEIKDLLRLKLCNADIYMYTSQFMEIQQWEKVSLAVYVHWFKTEAKRCNFTNNAAPIRIFIKGLKMPTV